MPDRDYIIEEIRRTAIENGGAPLGSRRFADATGIKEADWKGRHWARWSEALREAGLPPNALQTALADDDLLSKVVALVRELGRFPVKAEFQIKAHADKTFPSYTAIRRRGAPRELAAKLVAYCERHSGLDEVASLCSAAIDLSTQKQQHAPTDSPTVTFGEVYLLRFGRHHKIGRTNAVGRRERELAVQLPEKTALVHTIKTDDPPGIESYWHRRFADRRKNGEWFELTATDIAAFRRRRFM